MQGDPKPEFSREIVADEVPAQGRTVDLTPTPAEREALAARLGLVELSVLNFKGSVRPWRRNGLTLEGSIKADLIQSCVVSLEPVAEKIRETIKIHFLPDEMIERDERRRSRGEEREIVIDIEADDPPEPMDNGRIDMGEAIAEQLSLLMNPYPRKPEADFQADHAPEGNPKNAFGSLSRLKNDE